MKYDLLPDDEKEKLEKDYISKILAETTSYMNQNNFETAIVSMVLLLRNMEEMSWHKKRMNVYNLVNNVLEVYSRKVLKLKASIPYKKD